VLPVLRTGARWHDLPERYGKYAIDALGAGWRVAGHLRGSGADKKKRYL
jgi:hypothetical protein